MVKSWSITQTEAEYLEIFDTGGNVFFIKLFAEVKHVGGEQGLAVCPSEGETEVNETQV